MKPKPIKITGNPPTPWETAKIFGMSRKEFDELEKGVLDAYFAKEREEDEAWLAHIGSLIRGRSK